jgi:hypothetical protein
MLLGTSEMKTQLKPVRPSVAKTTMSVGGSSDDSELKVIIEVAVVDDSSATSNSDLVSAFTEFEKDFMLDIPINTRVYSHKKQDSPYRMDFT